MPDLLLTVANHEGLIDAQLWLAVQEKLERNSQINRANAGKYSFLTGLLKCAKCGYALKIAGSDGSLHLLCSGRSNFSVCDASIQVDIRELEDYIAGQISEILQESPPTEIIPEPSELSAEVLLIEQKIERLVGVLAECSDVSAQYISKQIEVLHKQREELLKRAQHEPPDVKHLDFDALSFEEKKLIAKEFIERIEISGNNVNIIWKI